MTAEDGKHVTADWRDLADDDDPVDALEVAELLDTAPTKHLGSLVGAVVERALGLLFHGGAEDNEGRLLAHLRAATERAAQDELALDVDGQGLVAASALLACLSGGSPIADPGTLARRWAPEAADSVDELDDDARNDWALVCAAHGLDDLVERFLEAPPPVVEPAELARAVAAAAATGDDTAIRAAWESFVAGFPASYYRGSVQLSSLLHAAWGIEVRLGGGSPERVLVALEAATGLRLRR